MAYHNDGPNPANYAGSTAVKPPTVQSALEDFDPIIGRLETLANRVTGCGDRIVGARPSEVEGNEKPPSPNHLIYALHARRERLLRVVNHIESEVQRIENGL